MRALVVYESMFGNARRRWPRCIVRGLGDAPLLGVADAGPERSPGSPAGGRRPDARSRHGERPHPHGGDRQQAQAPGPRASPWTRRRTGPDARATGPTGSPSAARLPGPPRSTRACTGRLPLTGRARAASRRGSSGTAASLGRSRRRASSSERDDDPRRGRGRSGRRMGRVPGPSHWCRPERWACPRVPCATGTSRVGALTRRLARDASRAIRETRRPWARHCALVRAQRQRPHLAGEVAAGCRGGPGRAGPPPTARASRRSRARPRGGSRRSGSPRRARRCRRRSRRRPPPSPRGPARARPGVSISAPPPGSGTRWRAVVVWRPLASPARTSPVASASRAHEGVDEARLARARLADQHQRAVGTRQRGDRGRAPPPCGAHGVDVHAERHLGGRARASARLVVEVGLGQGDHRAWRPTPTPGRGRGAGAGRAAAGRGPARPRPRPRWRRSPARRRRRPAARRESSGAALQHGRDPAAGARDPVAGRPGRRPRTGPALGADREGAAAVDAADAGRGGAGQRRARPARAWRAGVPSERRERRRVVAMHFEDSLEEGAPGGARPRLAGSGDGGARDGHGGAGRRCRPGGHHGVHAAWPSSRRVRDMREATRRLPITVKRRARGPRHRRGGDRPGRLGTLAVMRRRRRGDRRPGRLRDRPTTRCRASAPQASDRAPRAQPGRRASGAPGAQVDALRRRQAEARGHPGRGGSAPRPTGADWRSRARRPIAPSPRRSRATTTRPRSHRLRADAQRRLRALRGRIDAALRRRLSRPSVADRAPDAASGRPASA